MMMNELQRKAMRNSPVYRALILDLIEANILPADVGKALLDKGPKAAADAAGGSGGSSSSGGSGA